MMIVARTGVHISEQTATTIAACEAAAVLFGLPDSEEPAVNVVAVEIIGFRPADRVHREQHASNPGLHPRPAMIARLRLELSAGSPTGSLRTPE